MYSRKNSYASSPGVWFTEDGEYEFFKTGKTWNCRYRAFWNEATHTRTSRLIGTGQTLNDVFAIAGRYYMHPVIPTDDWVYP